jgi:hypothetical protein
MRRTACIVLKEHLAQEKRAHTVGWYEKNRFSVIVAQIVL